jgi:hypothetical protein
MSLIARMGSFLPGQLAKGSCLIRLAKGLWFVSCLSPFLFLDMVATVENRQNTILRPHARCRRARRTRGASNPKLRLSYVFILSQLPPANPRTSSNSKMGTGFVTVTPPNFSPNNRRVFLRVIPYCPSVLMICRVRLGRQCQSRSRSRRILPVFLMQRRYVFSWFSAATNQ